GCQGANRLPAFRNQVEKLVACRVAPEVGDEEAGDLAERPSPTKHVTEGDRPFTEVVADEFEKRHELGCPEEKARACKHHGPQSEERSRHGAIARGWLLRGVRFPIGAG